MLGKLRMINPVLLKEEVIKDLQKKYLDAKPFPHIALKNFLEKKEAEELRKNLLKLDYELKDSDLFTLYQSGDLTGETNKQVKKFVEFLRSPECKILFEKITGLNLTGKIDCSAAVYTDTCHLLPHNDEVEKRVLAYTLNLTSDFKKEDGGSLTLLGEEKVSYTPTFNTLVLFGVSSDSFHEVEEVKVNKTRLAINGWYND